MKQHETVTAMIECPKGFNQKFDFDPKEQRFRLSKILPAGLVFPFDFGMIPGTKGEDGDPLDIIVVSESATFPRLPDRLPYRRCAAGGTDRTRWAHHAE